MEKRTYKRIDSDREQSSQNILYGIRPVEEAMLEGKTLEKVLIQKGIKNPAINRLISLLSERKAAFQFVPEEKLDRTTSGQHQGVIAYVSEVDYSQIEDIIPSLFEQSKTPFIIVLDRITDVRNFGAIARSAECLGVDAIVVPSRGGALIGPDAMKVSAGALNHIPICRADNLKKTLLFLRDSGLYLVGCSEKADKNLDKIMFDQPLAVILGSEENGVSEEYLKLCDENAKINLVGKTASLNVSVAGAILMYEVAKQRMS
jgi:23S rRNA (guanosine2251-2'-O)-methyltransferase